MDYIIETCPECGSDLAETQLMSYPPRLQKRCLKCGWSWVEGSSKIVRVPFDESKYAIKQEVTNVKHEENVTEDDLMCCMNCKYWDCYNEKEFEQCGELAEGECRRYPPSLPIFDQCGIDDVPVSDLVISLTKGTPLVSNPFTFGRDWCGEFVLMKNPRYTGEE